MAYPIFQPADVPSGATTTITVPLPAKGRLGYAGVTCDGGTQGPFWVALAVKTAGFTIGIGKPGWIRGGSILGPEDYVAKDVNIPLGIVQPGGNSIVAFVRNDTGSSGKVDVIGYVED